MDKIEDLGPGVTKVGRAAIGKRSEYGCSTSASRLSYGFRTAFVRTIMRINDHSKHAKMDGSFCV